MPELPSNVFGPLLAMVIVFALDWRMGLAGLATIPLGVLFYAAMMRDYKPKMARYIGSEQRMNSSLVEYVNLSLIHILIAVDAEDCARIDVQVRS